MHTETLDGVHSVSWKLGPLLADGHFFSSEHSSTGFTFRVLGWVCSLTCDAFPDFLDGPCAASHLLRELSFLLFSFSLRFTVNYLQAVQTLCPSHHQKSEVGMSGFVPTGLCLSFPLGRGGGVLREQILEPLLVNTVGGVLEGATDCS